MDRFRQKTKKDKKMVYGEKDKAPLFIKDVKSIKENLKIKEILKSVKMNSSMRIKAPRGKKVMQNRDFTDSNEDFCDYVPSSGIEENNIESPSATNTDVINKIENIDKNSTSDMESLNTPTSDLNKQLSNCELNDTNGMAFDTGSVNELNDMSESSVISTPNDNESLTNNLLIPDIVTPTESTNENSRVKKGRDRKLSLDQTMLSRREGLSQSELDLHLIGKSPLERKSSFFRKRMDSFLKNTTEIFKRQSLGNKPQPIHRRGSMSVSLQSLNEKTVLDNNSDFKKDSLHNEQEMLQGSATSLQSSSTLDRSMSSLSANPGEQLHSGQPCEKSLAGSQPLLSASQPLAEVSSDSIHSLNEAYLQDTLLNSRAISMGSGLDCARGQRRKNRSNRVTWVASEGLTNYFRRIIQDEKSKERHICHSYQDFSTIPENNTHGPKLDSKGRRLSYQRAVSGEDPIVSSRYHDSNLRRRPYIPEHVEANFELYNHLAEFSRTGVPSLKGFCIANIPEDAFAYLRWAERAQNLDEFYDWKKLNTNEEARQAVIKELVCTEADYIRHLISIVEVFMAAAHALQDSGKLLEVDTERLFSNIPDVLNASLYFWEIAIYPMLADAREKKNPFNTELMSPGFCRFRELFQPYEKYVIEQTKALDYLRSLSHNSDFMMYLSWCHSHKSCNRLQLSDIMVKPMQRLTKYSLILRRIIMHTDTEPERTSLIAMESFAKNYVLDLNRSIRQREELEKLDVLANSIDIFEIDFKDDDMDRYFRMYTQLNLKAPMVNCLPSHSRTVIHQGDLRFKDNVKEMDVRAFLLTDMLLICKKLSKGSSLPFKLIRPKFMVDKMMHFPKYSKSNTKDMVALIFVMLDEVGSSYYTFALSESAKDANPQATLKLWEQKIKEARLTYDLGVWFAKNPSRDLSEVEMDSSSDYGFSGTSGSKPQGVKQSSDDLNIEREARERVAAMLHRSMGASTEYDFSQASMTTDSFDGPERAGEASGAGASGGRTPGLHSLRHPMQRNSTGGSSRLSSFQQSTSAASHDEPQPGPSKHNYRAGSSAEHLIPPLNPDGITSITVNVVSESESETVVPVLEQASSSSLMTTPRPSSTQNTLRVQPQSGVLALVHSLPDLTIDPSPSRSPQSPSPQSASERLYHSHQILLQRNRLSASQQHQYLSPDHRGTSYPPPSPTRASLKRGLAFSYSFKNPPLSKMGHVNSQSQLQADAGPSTSQQPKSEKGAINQVLVPSTSTDKGDKDKGDKKSKHVSSRHKDGGSLSPSRKEDKGD